jgi:hypothetical protein
VYGHRRIVLVLAAVAALVFTFSAFGSSKDDGSGTGEALVRAALAPSVPADPAFHGITAAGAPWVMRDGHVRYQPDGELEVRIRGLVLTSTGTAGPVTTVSVSLLCGADSQLGPAATTGTFPLSQAGNAHIETTLAPPATCLAPIFVVHPNGGTTRYIAVTGWKMAAA